MSTKFFNNMTLSNSNGKILRILFLLTLVQVNKSSCCTDVILVNSVLFTCTALRNIQTRESIIINNIQMQLYLHFITNKTFLKVVGSGEPYEHNILIVLNVLTD